MQNGSSLHKAISAYGVISSCYIKLISSSLFLICTSNLHAFPPGISCCRKVFAFDRFMNQAHRHFAVCMRKTFKTWITFSPIIAMPLHEPTVGPGF